MKDYDEFVEFEFLRDANSTLRRIATLSRTYNWGDAFVA